MPLTQELRSNKTSEYEIKRIDGATFEINPADHNVYRNGTDAPLQITTMQVPATCNADIKTFGAWQSCRPGATLKPGKACHVVCDVGA